MKKLLLSLCFIIFSIPAFADTINSIDINGLTDDQKAQLVIEANKMKTKGTPIGINEYAEIGQKYGVALANVAKEMGMAVNEIADTYVGKVALVLIVWKIMGQDAIGFIAGFTWLFFVIPIWIVFFRRLVFKGRLVEEILNDKGKVSKRIYEPFFDSGDGIAGLMLLMCLVLVLISFAGFVMIF